MKFAKVLVPFTGARADAEALRLACDLVKRARGQLYVVYVIEVKRNLPVDAELEVEIKEGEQVLAQAERIAGEQDCQLEVDLLQARQAGPAIVNEVSELGIDTIVMGIQQRLRFGTYRVGSTALYIFQHAPCGILMYQEPMPSEEVATR